MKREQISQQNYIDWLKSLGCVFYAPLSNGDTMDYISGQYLSVSNGTVMWNNSQNAYQFNGPTQLNNYIASWNNLNMNININNFCSSWMFEIYYFSSKFVVPVCLGGRSFAIATAASEIGGVGQWGKWATTVPASDGINHRIQMYYANGNVLGSVDRGVAATTLSSVAKTRIECNNSGAYSSYLNNNYCIRNILFFNTVLDLQTIIKIQGYE